MPRTPAWSALVLLAACAVVASPAVAAGADPTRDILVRLAPGVPVTALGPDAAPLVDPVRVARVRAAGGRAARPAPDLGRWAVVRAPEGTAARVLAGLRGTPGVRSATPAGPPPPAPAQQCRLLPPGLGPAPFSLAAGVPDLTGLQNLPDHFGMRNLPAGGDGAGVRVADIEYDWDRTHVELADRALPAPVRPGSTPAQNVSHGTAALSVIGARADGIGITGLAPGATLIPVGPWVGTTYNPAAAIIAAADRLSPGDVLLIEQQSRLRGPADTGDYGEPVAAAIAAASAKGIVVVLPAGNGGRHLDEFERPATDTAIMVGGGQVAEGDGISGVRHPSSNFGARVDVQGPAHSVVAATAAPSYYGYLAGGADEPGRSYTHCFNGTSSASAAVAGAIAAMQGVARAGRGTPFTPAEVLQRLVATGLPQVSQQRDNIGPVPQIAAAADMEAPGIPRLDIGNGARLAAGTFEVTWRSGDDVGASGRGDDLVLLDGAVVARVGHGVGRATVAIPAGSRRIAVRSLDMVGNASEAAVVVEAIDDPARLLAPPAPPGLGGVADPLPAGRVVSGRWNRAAGVLTLRVRLAPGARVLVSRRAAVARRGVLRVRLVRPGVRDVALGAKGYRTVRLRVVVTADGRVEIRRRR